MKKTLLYKTISILVALVARQGSSESLPNIVLIVADDLGYGDLGCYGNSSVQTPHLDRMAREGVLFTDFYANGPMCAPTRAALVTGRYQQRVGVSLIGGHLHEGEVVIAQRLRDEAGYATGFFGKWHVSGNYPTEDVRMNEMPIDYGFDEYRGLMSGFIDHISHLDDRGILDWWHNRELIEEEGYAAHLLTRHTIEFIREHHENKPVFAVLSLPDIHFPWMTPEDPPYFIEDHVHQNFDPKHNRLGPHDGTERLQSVVHRMIKETDRCTGWIIEALEELGISENTFVFFVSDNGGIVSYRGRNTGQISCNGPLRGEKIMLYEGGIRVPAIAWHPGSIPAGMVSHEAAATFDLFPTFLEMAGLEEPDANGPNALDGISLKTHMYEARSLPDRKIFFEFRDRYAIRSGDWKFLRQRGRLELYNLSEDIGETTNLANVELDLVRTFDKAVVHFAEDVQGKQLPFLKP